MEDEKLLNTIAQRIVEAERRMINDFNRDLFSGPILEVVPLEETFLEKLQYKLSKLYLWWKSRIVGTWNLWLKGECDFCERYDEHY